MRVGIIQSNYMPWRGYFDFIDDTDLFIFLDDVQFTRRDWRNRNKIKTPNGLRWLTVPVQYGERSRLINETKIDYSKQWQRDHLTQLERCYDKLSFFTSYSDKFVTIINSEYSSISDLNVTLCKWLMTALDITTPTTMSHEYDLSGTKTERLVELMTKVGGSTYLSGPSAQGYLDLEMFRCHGITVEYKSYQYLPYPQPWGVFEGNVSVLDLLFNTGPDARKYLKSTLPNVVVP